jgi:hypothetical protein
MSIHQMKKTWLLNFSNEHYFMFSYLQMILHLRASKCFSSIGVSMNIKTFSTQESLLVEAVNFCVLYLHLTCFT